MNIECRKVDFYIRAVLVNRSVVVYCKNKNKITILKELNANRRWFNRALWDIKYKNDNELAKILVKLKENEVKFSSDPHGWGPSEIFFNLKEKGIVTGEVEVISWLGNGMCRIIRKAQ